MKEIEELKKLKKVEKGKNIEIQGNERTHIHSFTLAERGEKYDGSFNAWDSSYYQRILLENNYAVDQEEIKKYFSLETTIQSKLFSMHKFSLNGLYWLFFFIEMLDIYEKVLGLKFVKVPSEKAIVWHPDVQLFECWDAVEDQSFSGYMYLDLFPRDNKCKYFYLWNWMIMVVKW